MRNSLKFVIITLMLLLQTAGTGLWAQYDKDVFFMRGRHALSEG